MEVFQEKEPGRENSFWYNGDIAIEGDCILIAEGEIRVTFPDGYVGRDWHAVEHAMDLGYTDVDLGKFEWDMNNWFEVVSKKGESILGDVVYEYDAAIELLKQYVRDKVYGGD